MTYSEAKKRIIVKWLLGVPIVAASSLSTIISSLKMFYFGLDSGDSLENAITGPIRKLVYVVYDHTGFLKFFWAHSPVPNLDDFLASSTIVSLAIYLCIFVGLGLTGSARSFSARIAEIDKEVENELMRQSIRGGYVHKRDHIQARVSVTQTGWLYQLHTLYLAPILVGLVVAIIAKLSGLV